MYLELSGRQTHKTSHLLNDIHNWLSQSDRNVACLTVWRLSYGKDLLHLMRETFPRMDINRVHVHSDYNAHGRIFRGATRTLRPKYYWDEFDFMKPENVPVKQDGYYTTTPKRTRTIDDWKNWHEDALLRLLVANDFRYTACHGFKLFFEDGELNVKKLEELSKRYQPDQFNNEFMSGFDWVENNKKENTQCSPNQNCKKSEPSLEVSAQIPVSTLAAILKSFASQVNGGHDIPLS